MGRSIRTLAILLIGSALLTGAVADASPLSSAAKKGRLQKVEELIAAGADVDERDRKGNTAIYQAAYKGHADVVKALAASSNWPGISRP